MRRALGAILFAVSMLAPQARAQDNGAAALANAMALLGDSTPRVLYIAAHPDDEDVRLITWLSRSGRAEVAYLSLTRGDGGQNLIGDELGEALGVLRTQELLAARRVDGAKQYFTRAYDFGYSKSAEETYTHWPRDSVLGDVIKVVRAFRPHVIVATFSGTPRDAHGQHQVSGQLARDAYDLAGDARRFPAARFGEPWMPLKLYRNGSFYPDGPHVTMNVGEYDHLRGMSYDEIASQSRSNHKSQGLRGNFRLGEVVVRYYREASRVTPEVPREQERSILDGLAADRVVSRRPHPQYQPEAAIGAINRTPPRGGSRAAYDRAVVAAAALALEVIAPRPYVAVGDSIVLDYALHNRGTLAVRVDSAAGSFPAAIIAPGKSARWSAVFRPARKLEPWWLTQPRAGDMFALPIPVESDDEIARRDWPIVRVAVGGAAEPVLMSARPMYRLSEGFYGDAYSPLVAAPGLTITPAPAHSFARAGAAFERDVYASVRSSFDAARDVTVRLELPAGLSASPAEARMTLPPGATRTVVFRISGRAPAGGHRLGLSAESNGVVFRESVRTIDYPHVALQQMYEPSAIMLHAVPVEVAPGLRVGYIAGKADPGPQVLRELGVPVTLIEPAEIPRLDLSSFPVIVVGPRMYEASPELVEHNGRLLEYAGNGGRLVVQFGQYMMSGAGILPYRITISRPPDRVTDERAAVTITDPAARELTHPNRITLADFEGWVQERATFMPDEYDGRYRTMLAMSDPGEQPVHSSVLVAPVGSGTYVYVTLALFRQLEEGIPGAVRLFVNLLTP